MNKWIQANYLLIFQKKKIRSHWKKKTLLLPIIGETYNEELNITKEIKKKRPRFFSENEENLFVNGKTKNGLKIKTIDKKLKNFTEDELINSNIRKFSFV